MSWWIHRCGFGSSPTVCLMLKSLIGDRGGRRNLLAAFYEKMHQARIVSHSDVVAFVRDRNLNGRGVGWIDNHLLASAVLERLSLWTVDPRFAAIASELGVAYQRSTS